MDFSGGAEFGVSTGFPPVDDRSGDEEDGHDDGDPEWGEDAGLDLPPVVQDSQADCDIDEFVELVPALSAEAAYRAGGGKMIYRPS